MTTRNTNKTTRNSVNEKLLLEERLAVVVAKVVEVVKVWLFKGNIFGTHLVCQNTLFE